LITDGQILLDKPAGMTSFTALGDLKRSLGTRRVGHAGTLDKFATGLLIVLVGRYTKLAGLFTGLDKCYRATFVLGTTTDTLDPEGTVTGEGPLPDLRRIEEAAVRLTGTIDQVPPAYSAVHVDGRRAYRIARSGGDLRLEPRRVTIHRFEIMDYRAPELEIEVECSKGTYVRALARDMGLLSGSCAYVKSLRRTRIGPYHVECAVGADITSAHRLLSGSVQRLLHLSGVHPLSVKDEWTARVRNGQRLSGRFFQRQPRSDGLFALLDSGGKLLALAIREGGEYRYKMVM
jgi:tRNA pseudouridine55 synthase